MSEIQELIQRFVDDRESLTEQEWGTFLAELEKSPTLTASLRDQLLLDEYLSQKIGADRLNFASQIEQRVADYESQIADTYNLVAELRSLAEDELAHPTLRPAASWRPWGMSLAIVVAAASLLGILGSQLNWGQPTTVAVVEEVSGIVHVERGNESIPLALGKEIDTSEQMSTGEDGSVTWRYADGTQIRLAANTTVRLRRHPDHGGKRIELNRGKLFADIAPQLAGRPMTFVTPHAEAKVVGTKFQLCVRELDTELEVTEGTVDFSRIGAKETVRVVSNEMSRIGGATIERKPIAWPVQRNEDSLVFLFRGFMEPTLARNPESNNLRITPWQGRGDVDLWHDQALSLNGGSYFSSDAGIDLLELFRQQNQLTVEVIVGAEGMGAMSTASQGTVVSFASLAQAGNFALRTDGGRWLADLKTEDNPNRTLSWPLYATDSPLHHVAWTYTPGNWIGYCDGQPLERISDVTGSFQNWNSGSLVIGANEDEQNPWIGNLFGLAIYRRALSAEELAQNARHARIVYGAIGQ